MSSSAYIIAYGNPADGFGYVGPFCNSDDAAEYASTNLEEWWIVPLESVPPGEASDTVIPDDKQQSFSRTMK